MDTLTHSRSRYLGIRSAIALAVAGDISLGFKMTALPKYYVLLRGIIESKKKTLKVKSIEREMLIPAAMAGRTGARVSRRGKFHAPITRTVP